MGRVRTDSESGREQLLQPALTIGTQVVYDDEAPVAAVDEEFALLAPSPAAAVVVAVLSPEAAAGVASGELPAPPSFLSVLSVLLSSAPSLAGCVVEDEFRLSLM